MTREIAITPMPEEAWSEVRRIYASGIATGVATFETQVPEWEAWDQAHRKECRLIAVIAERVAGFAALSDVSRRLAYRGVAEVSVYVDAAYRHQGVGSALLARLIEASEASGIWTLQASIFVENEASIRLHAKQGFRMVGVRERLGKLDGAWHDVVLLERRSRVAGID